MTISPPDDLDAAMAWIEELASQDCSLLREIPSGQPIGLASSS